MYSAYRYLSSFFTPAASEPEAAAEAPLANQTASQPPLDHNSDFSLKLQGVIAAYDRTGFIALLTPNPLLVTTLPESSFLKNIPPKNWDLFYEHVRHVEDLKLALAYLRVKRNIEKTNKHSGQLEKKEKELRTLDMALHGFVDAEKALKEAEKAEARSTAPSISL
jgi:hypothetical protein